MSSARRSSDFAQTIRGNVVETKAGTFRSRYVINCAGLYSDAITRMAGLETNLEIIPFRGEYYEIRPERRSLVKNLIYPVPDPRFPFLGVHFTRRVNGSVEAGPNAVLAFRREGYSGSSPDMAEATRDAALRRLLEDGKEVLAEGHGRAIPLLESSRRSPKRCRR